LRCRTSRYARNDAVPHGAGCRKHSAG
jgi:hypothetical protein